MLLGTNGPKPGLLYGKLRSEFRISAVRQFARQRWTQYSDRTWPYESRLFDFQEQSCSKNIRELQRAVPSGVFQRAEPRQLLRAGYSGQHRYFRFNVVAHWRGRSIDVDNDDSARNSIRDKAVLVIR